MPGHANPERPLFENEPTIRSALSVMQRAGIAAEWIPPSDPAGTHTFVAVSTEGEESHQFVVTSPDPLGGITELMHQLGFEDLD